MRLGLRLPGGNRPTDKYDNDHAKQDHSFVREPAPDTGFLHQGYGTRSCRTGNALCGRTEPGDGACRRDCSRGESRHAYLTSRNGPQFLRLRRRRAGPFGLPDLAHAPHHEAHSRHLPRLCRGQLRASARTDKRGGAAAPFRARHGTGRFRAGRRHVPFGHADAGRDGPHDRAHGATAPGRQGGPHSTYRR